MPLQWVTHGKADAGLTLVLTWLATLLCLYYLQYDMYAIAPIPKATIKCILLIISIY